MRDNLYWVQGNPSWAENFVAENRAAGVDAGSLAVDPGLRRGADGRVSFDPAVLARLGIKPFDWDAVGLPGGSPEPAP
jgi:hypothetical protein